VAAKGDGDAFREVWPRRQARLQQRAHVSAYLLRLRGANYAGKGQRGHQANGADGQLRVLLNRMVAEDVDLQAAAAEVRDAARRRFRSERCDGRFPSQPRFFRSADYLERDACLLFDLPDEGVAIARFAGSAGGHGAITRHAKFVHHFLEMAKRFHTLLESIFAETMAQEYAFAEA